MTCHAEKSNEQMVSEFITGTCQLLQKSCAPTSDHMHAFTVSLDPAHKGYSIVSGSQAEFYIRPLNTCIGDIDFLQCMADELACFSDFPVLPSDRTGLADTIECYKIESYQRFPGFVRIRFLCKIIYNWNHKRYEFKKSALSGSPDYKMVKMNITNTHLDDPILRYLNKSNPLPMTVSGPAVKAKIDSDGFNGYDSVKSVYCSQWPREANNWPIRSRKYEWPTNDIIYDSAVQPF